MTCKCGDAIKQEKIQRYTSLLERVGFSDVKNYELDIEDCKELYAYIDDYMAKLGYVNNKAINITTYDFNRTVANTDSLKCNVSILVKRDTNYDYVSTDTQIAKIVALIQNMLVLNFRNMHYIHSFNKKIRTNTEKITKDYLKCYYSGYYIQELSATLFNDAKQAEEFINTQLEFINTQLESCTVKKVCINNNYVVMPSDYNMMIGILDYKAFKDLISRYDSLYNTEQDIVTIKEQDIRASISIMLRDKKVKKSNFEIKIIKQDDKWIMSFFAVASISPYLVIKTLYSKIKLTEIYHNSNFIITGIYRDLNKIDKADIVNTKKICDCGKPLLYDIVKQKVSDKCSDCISNLLLSAYIQKKTKFVKK